MPERANIVEDKIWARHGLTKREWESLCHRCGECCHKLDEDHNPIPGEYCRYLAEGRDGRKICQLYPWQLGVITQKAEDPKDDVFCAQIQFGIYRGRGCGYNQYLPPLRKWKK